MASKKRAVFGIFSTRSQAENAFEALTKSGFSISDISVVIPETLGSQEIKMEKATKAPEGAVAGASTGAVVGGTLGLLVGLGALAIPGIGPLLAAGPVVAALAGAGAVGVAGGIVGSLVGVGIPEYEAKRYEGRLQKGGMLVSIHCDTSEEIDRAKHILEGMGGEDVSSTGESSTGEKSHGATAR